jgi:nucleoside-diphosphate-sugar epimerase
VYVLRPAAFAGPSADNYLVAVLRGTPAGHGKLASMLLRERKRLPCILPWGKRYLENRVQFVHVDDLARLIAYILRKTEPEARRLTVLNVSGRGEPLTWGSCLKISQAKLVRVPGVWGMRILLKIFWKTGISRIPPEATPYLSGEEIMNTARLREFLGPYDADVIRYTVSDALVDSFPGTSSAQVHSPRVA